MDLFRHGVAAAVGAVLTFVVARGVVMPGLVAVGTGAAFILLLPRHPRLVVTAIAGALVVILVWSVLWTLSW